MDAKRAVVPPVIDGRIDSGEWQTASRGEDFVQFEPNRGDVAELQTVVYVLYDDEHLYVAFEAHDPEPLMAQMTRRDAQLSSRRLKASRATKRPPSVSRRSEVTRPIR